MAMDVEEIEAREERSTWRRERRRCVGCGLLISRGLRCGPCRKEHEAELRAARTAVRAQEGQARRIASTPASLAASLAQVATRPAPARRPARPAAASALMSLATEGPTSLPPTPSTDGAEAGASGAGKDQEPRRTARKPLALALAEDLFPRATMDGGGGQRTVPYKLTTSPDKVVDESGKPRLTEELMRYITGGRSPVSDALLKRLKEECPDEYPFFRAYLRDLVQTQRRTGRPSLTREEMWQLATRHGLGINAAYEARKTCLDYCHFQVTALRAAARLQEAVSRGAEGVDNPALPLVSA